MTGLSASLELTNRYRTLASIQFIYQVKLLYINLLQVTNIYYG